MVAKKMNQPKSTNKKAHLNTQYNAAALNPVKKPMSLRYSPMTTEERRHKIAQEAYLRAEKRGFNPDGQMQDWLEAEAKIDALQMQHSRN